MNSSREKILAAVSKNKPSLVPLPDVIIEAAHDPLVLVAQFAFMLQSIGATVINTESTRIIQDDLQSDESTGGTVINTIESIGAISQGVNVTSDALSLEAVEVAYISGTLGVAENGAIWLEESKMVNRLLPFICQHLVIVLEAANIVANMHEAYKQITIDKEGYGVFLAGPSKTADIEQSLVIGAHGAKSLRVYIISPQ